MQILIDGLPPQFSSDILSDLLRPCGTVLSADIFRDDQGASLGLGSVVMAQAEEAEQVRLALDGRDFDGIPIVVLVSKEPLTDVELAFETLESVVEFRKRQVGLVEDPIGHTILSLALEQLGKQ